MCVYTHATPPSQLCFKPFNTTTGDQKRHLDHLAIQSGGFTTEFFDRLSAGGALGGALDALTDGRGGTMDVRAAMAQAEDEHDAAAAAALEQETAAELQEFAAEGQAAAEEGDEDEEEGEEPARWVVTGRVRCLYSPVLDTALLGSVLMSAS